LRHSVDWGRLNCLHVRNHVTDSQKRAFRNQAYDRS
jgi:hypothetical protein